MHKDEKIFFILALAFFRLQVVFNFGDGDYGAGKLHT